MTISDLEALSGRHSLSVKNLEMEQSGGRNLQGVIIPGSSKCVKIASFQPTKRQTVTYLEDTGICYITLSTQTMHQFKGKSLIYCFFDSSPRKWVPFNDEKVNLSAIHGYASKLRAPKHQHLGSLRLKHDAIGRHPAFCLGAWWIFRAFAVKLLGRGDSGFLLKSHEFFERAILVRFWISQRFDVPKGFKVLAERQLLSSWWFGGFSPPARFATPVTHFLRPFIGSTEYSITPFITSFITSRGPPCSFLNWANYGTLPNLNFCVGGRFAREAPHFIRKLGRTLWNLWTNQLNGLPPFDVSTK